jgi:hypothetical protein
VIELNLRAQMVLYWMDGRYLKKERCMKLPQPGLAWRPYVKFEKIDQIVILNPFCKRPAPNPNLTENRSKLPDNMFVDLSHS